MIMSTPKRNTQPDHKKHHMQIVVIRPLSVSLVMECESTQRHDELCRGGKVVVYEAAMGLMGSELLLMRLSLHGYLKASLAVSTPR